MCSASHDITTLTRELVTGPIVIENHAWVGARAFIGPGVTVGECAVVTKDVAPWTVVAGSPAGVVKERVIREDE